MLEFLRRHNKTFFLVVTAVVIISFTFWGSYTKTGNRPGQITADDTAFTVFGEDHDYAEYKRLSRYYQVASRLGLSVLGGRAGFGDALAGFAMRYQAREEVPRDFVFNLILLRHLLKENGIHASDSEVKEQFRRLPVFQTNGELDRAKLEGFENSIGMFGMRASDVYDLVRDWLGLEKLIQVVAANTVPSPYMAAQFYSATCQTIQAATIPFVLEDFKKSVQVTDEEIAKYFDQKKDQFKTPEKRAVSFVLFESPKGLDDKLPLEERIKKNGEFSRAVEDFSNEAFAGGKFDDLAKKFSKEIKRLPAFAREELPEDLKKEQELIFEVFRNDPKSHPVSEPVQSEKGYYFFAVTEIQEPRQQELKDAQAKIKDILVAQKAQEAMMKAANDARKGLEDAIKSGKSFAEAAKAAKLEPQILPEFTPTEPPRDLANGNQIAGEAQQTPAGSFSKRPLVTENGVLLLFVLSKELRKREDSATLRVRVDDSLTMLAQRDIFRAWFDRQRDEANVKSNLPDQM